MIKTVFYSWQSDLPNETNRKFIEDCIINGINKANVSQDFNVELNLDRDTKGELGTPDIVKSIFNKIDKSAIFIADISLINPDYPSKKTPNPNVLLELGYAINILGWNRIICIFNNDYGKIEELPFDLRFRKPQRYSINENGKENSKNSLIESIAIAINQIVSHGLLESEIEDYIKVQIDTEILSLINHLIKIVNNYDLKNSSPEGISTFLNLNADQLKSSLKEREFLGFQIFKKFDALEMKFNKLLANPVVVNNLNNNQINSIIQLLKNIRTFEYIHNWRIIPNLYISLNKKDTNYKSISGKIMNESNPENSFLLLSQINNQEGIVVDSGIFIEKDKIDNLINIFKINEKYLELYSETLYDFIKYINNWLILTGDEFIIDNKIFLIKNKPNRA